MDSRAVAAAVLVAVCVTLLPVSGHRAVWDEKVWTGQPGPYCHPQHIPTMLWGSSRELEAIQVPIYNRQLYYRPLALVATAMASFAWGRDPLPIAWLTLLLHAIVTAVWTLWVARATGDRRLAALTGIIFGLHPLGIANGAWIGIRNDPAVALLMVLGLHAASSRGPAALHMLLFALALGFKEMAVVYPVIVIALQRSGACPPASGRQQATLALGCLLVMIAYLVLRGRALGHSEKTLVSASGYLTYLIESAWLLLLVLFSFAWPADLGTFYFEDRLARIHGALPGGVAVAGCLVLVYLAARFGSRRVQLAGSLIVVTTLPVLKLLPLASYPFNLSDRHLYVPALGLSLLAAMASMRLASSRVGGLIAAGVVLIWISFGQLRRVSLSTDSNFYLFEMEAAPLSAQLHSCLGHDLLMAGKRREAIEVLERAVELDPSLIQARQERMQAFAALGEKADVLHEFRAIEKLDPHYLLHKPTLFAWLAMAGHADLARDWVRRALEHSPGDAAILEGAGDVHAVLSEKDPALAAYRQAAALHPDPRLIQKIADVEKAAQLEENGPVEAR